MFARSTLQLATRARLASAASSCGARSLSTYYTPTLTERREGEAGIGARSSEAGLKVAVFGASGFLGNYLCSELGANGFMSYLANRGDDMEMRHLKVNYDIGRVRIVFYSPRDTESIKNVIADADVVVNLIGRCYPTGKAVQTDKFPYIGYQTNYSVEEANVTIARTLAEICYEMQVDNFIHVSSASASPTAMSEWSRAKYAGEQAVKEVYPWATIIRPTQLYGKQDKLLNWFAKVAQWYRCVPLVDGGKALTQPVWVGDVAKTILRVIDDPSKFEGRQIDCFGPTDYTYMELAEFVNDITERNKPILNVPHAYYKKIANVLQWQRDASIYPDFIDQMAEDFLPQMSMEAYKQQTDEATKILTMSDLGVEAMPIEKEAFSFLHYYRFGGHFYKTQGYHADAKIS